MKLITNYNQKVLIFLKRGGQGFSASLFVVSGLDHPFGQLVSKKTISQKEGEHLLANQESYKTQNIYIFEQIDQAATLLISGKTFATPSIYFYQTIPSQFVSSLFDTELFFSTQKTRAPTL